MAELFSLEELASYLQRDLDTATAELAAEMATALVESYARRSFTEQVEITEILRIGTGRIHLPLRPVSEVESVEYVDSDRRYPTTWVFDGIHTIYVGDYGQILNLPEMDSPGLRTVEVTWTHGYTEVPTDVKAVALTLAGRAYGNPRGLRSETIGNYSYTTAGGGDEVASFGLLAGEREVLNRYRVMASTLVLQ